MSSKAEYVAYIHVALTRIVFYLVRMQKSKYHVCAQIQVYGLFNFLFCNTENFKCMASLLGLHLHIQHKHGKNLLNFLSNHLLFQSSFPEK